MFKNLIITYRVFPYWKRLDSKLNHVLYVKNSIIDRELPTLRNITDRQALELLACLEEITAVAQYISFKYDIGLPYVLELGIAEYLR